jgi:hypothetical protein
MSRQRLAAAALSFAAACQSTGPADLASLAEAPPGEYSVLLSGGAFVAFEDAVPGEGPLVRTFAPTRDGSLEAIPLAEIADALQQARVFMRTDRDEGDAAARARLAALRGPLPLQDAELAALLASARDRGHDFLLLIERITDGPVEEHGINDRWPMTVALWLLVGLGMFIPDHTYESRAQLHFSLREVHTGQRVYERVLSGGEVELALVSRGSVWGIVTSIIIPPFWVPSDDELVVEQVRAVATQRMLFSLARDLKSVACRQRLRDTAPATIAVERAASGVTIRVRAAESLSLVRLRVDGQPLPADESDELQRALLRSARQGDEHLLYEAVLARVPPGRFLQVLLQTVGGRPMSTTVDLGEL